MSSNKKKPTKTQRLETPTPPARQWLQHLGAYFILLVISMLYFKPAAFDGKSLNQHDNVQAIAMQSEIMAYKEAQDGKEIRWTNQYFGGMPTALMRNDNINYIDSEVVFPLTLGYGYNEFMLLFFLMFSCYIGLSLMGVSWGVSLGFSAVLALFTANILYIQAGHTGKMVVVSTVPALVGAFVYAYRKNLLLGAAIFTTILSFNLAKNHVQMTYYMYFVLTILGVAFLIESVKQNQIKRFSAFAGTMIVASILAVLSNVGFLWASYEYGQESTRGKTELTQKEVKSGLDPDYIFSLSIEKGELAAIMFPNFYGATQSKLWVSNQGTASQAAFRSPRVQQELAAAAKANGVGDMNKFFQDIAISYTRQYRGSQTMSGGPIYYGVVVCFLFILALLLMQGALKWGIISSFIFLSILAMGKHFPVISDLMYNYFPLYSKFRDTKMTLLVFQPVAILTIGVGLMRLAKFDPVLYEHTWSAKVLPKLKQTVSRQGYVVLATAIALGICGFMFLYISTTTLSSPKDIELAAISPTLVAAMEEDRAAMAMADVWRALGFILAAFGVLFLYTKDMFKIELAAVALAVLACIDLGMINKDYVNEESFIKRKNFKDELIPTKQDQDILKDKGIYRVIDYSRGAPSQNAMASAFHKSIGGYFAAKPLLYQEFWSYYQMDNPNVALQSHINIFNMLNLKYIMLPQGRVMDNPTALGNAWFVEKVNVVPDADAEIAAIDALETINTAVVQERYAAYVEGLQSTYAPGDRIALKSYHPDTMTYEYEIKNERFAVFSEMYYPPSKGWKVYLDGEEVEPFVKTNYLLRGLRVPAGKHTIQMVFAPTSVNTGRYIGGAVSLIILLVLGFAIFRFYREKMKARAALEAAESPEGRPTSITVICVLGLLGAAGAIPLIMSGAAAQVGSWYPLALGLASVVGAVCMFGLWNMKKWAVYVYTGLTILNQFVLMFMGVWNILALVIPGVVIALAFSYIDRMD
jgi:hypothetical protein